jgi:CRISPR/Cas system CSM-associated protein Csm3 (group 7 of RAMP superfamily)
VSTLAIVVELTITCTSAFSIGAGGSSGTLADKSIVRDGWDRPIIPGSQLKGKLRWAVEQLLRGWGEDIPAPFEVPQRVELATKVRDLFGSPQHRSPLHFADVPALIGQPSEQEQLRASPEQHRSQVRPSVALSRRRGTAEDQRLLLQETALEQTIFYHPGAIIGRVNDKGHAALLCAALRLIPHWGGAKGRGLGWATVAAAVQLNGEHFDEQQQKTELHKLLKPQEQG